MAVVKDDDSTEVRIVSGDFWRKRGPGDRVARAGLPGYDRAARKRRPLPVETTRHSFAYVFAGARKFCNASPPLEAPKEPVAQCSMRPLRPTPTIAA